MVPSSWHDASVTALFKNGDLGLCKNYRPITVVSAGYKLFAIALLRRLQNAGAEKRIWPTQRFVPSVAVLTRSLLHGDFST